MSNKIIALNIKLDEINLILILGHFIQKLKNIHFFQKFFLLIKVLINYIIKNEL